MGTRDITHEALAKALSEGAALTDEQRAVLLGAVADDKAWQREVDRLLAENARLRRLLADVRAALTDDSPDIGAIRQAIDLELPNDKHAETIEPAPSNSLPDWDECALRVANSDFIAKRVSEGGYGADPDSKLATQLHRFIYYYDDADPHGSAWFLHRLELVLNEARGEVLNALAAVEDGYDIMGLAEEQRQKPGPFGVPGTPNAVFGANAKHEPAP